MRLSVSGNTKIPAFTCLFVRDNKQKPTLSAKKCFQYYSLPYSVITQAERGGSFSSLYGEMLS